MSLRVVLERAPRDHIVSGSLQSVVILLAATVGVVVLCRQLRLPPLLAYIVVGIVIGPNNLGWIADDEGTRHLAEFGIVFLMFSIGLEFSLPKLMTMRRLVFGLGSVLTFGAMAVFLLLVVAFGLGWPAGIAVGSAIALASTAILGKMLAERSELNTEHGRQIMGVSLFQDIAVVPLLIVLPTLSAPASAWASELAFAGLKAAIVLTLLLGVGQWILRPWFHLIASQKSSELFVLNVLLITLLLAWATQQAGLSLALGAFVAGMLISETEYRYQVAEDIKPFRDVLLGLFFVTVGMLLDPIVLWHEAAAVFGLLLAILVFKGVIAFVGSWLFRRDSGTSLRVALALCTGGEFGFVILTLAANWKVIDEPTLQVVLAALLFSMLLAPILVQSSDQLVRRWIASDWMQRAMALHNIAVQTMGASAHVIICGYGRSGQNLARLLEQEAIPFIALDVDPKRVKEAAIAGESVVFGDAARKEVLVAAGLMRAAAVVVSYADTRSALSILKSVQESRPGVPVIVRTRDDVDVEELKAAGAAEVVAEIMEGSLMMASHALMLVGVPLNRVLNRIRQTRQERYGLFRGFFPGATDEGEEIEEPVRLHSVLLAMGAGAVGKSLDEVGLSKVNVEVTAIRRRNIRSLAPTLDTRLAEGDVIVLRGRDSDLAVAETMLLQP